MVKASMSPLVLVTGASGFLAGALLRRLRALGVPALGVARRRGGDWLQVDAYQEAPATPVIVHLAETAHRGDHNAAGDSAAAAMTDALQALLQRRPSRLVYASSAAVYGDEADTPRREGDPVFAADSYARMKLAHERLVTGTAGIQGVAVRLANVYGAGMSRDNVLSTLLRQLPGEGPLQVLDDGPVRDYLHVDDAAAALAAMALGGHTGVYNVGTGIGTSVRDLGRAACAAAGIDPRPVEALRASGRRSVLVLDARAAQETFGWRPATDLQDGLARLLPHFEPQHP